MALDLSNLEDNKQLSKMIRQQVLAKHYCSFFGDLSYPIVKTFKNHEGKILPKIVFSQDYKLEDNPEYFMKFNLSAKNTTIKKLGTYVDKNCDKIIYERSEKGPIISKACFFVAKDFELKELRKFLSFVKLNNITFTSMVFWYDDCAEYYHTQKHDILSDIFL